MSAYAEQGAGRGQRPPLTPDQEAEQKKRAADTAIAEGVRPIDMLDSVWIEELSWMEVRDLMKDGKTTAFLGVGGVEKNGPYTATGKHNYTLKTTLEAIARKHGKALVAPLVTWEPAIPIARTSRPARSACRRRPTGRCFAMRSPASRAWASRTLSWSPTAAAIRRE